MSYVCRVQDRVMSEISDDGRGLTKLQSRERATHYFSTNGTVPQKNNKEI